MVGDAVCQLDAAASFDLVHTIVGHLCIDQSMASPVVTHLSRPTALSRCELRSPLGLDISILTSV